VLPGDGPVSSETCRNVVCFWTNFCEPVTIWVHLLVHIKKKCFSVSEFSLVRFVPPYINVHTCSLRSNVLHRYNGFGRIFNSDWAWLIVPLRLISKPLGQRTVCAIWVGLPNILILGLYWVRVWVHDEELGPTPVKSSRSVSHKFAASLRCLGSSLYKFWYRNRCPHDLMYVRPHVF
jgi:hypothetical protein